MLYRFNPRAHAGRDIIEQANPVWWVMVSIHAPTQGATKTEYADHLLSTGFNPRAHAGRDQRYLPYHLSRLRFNPRAHAGRDIKSGVLLPPSIVSIHAPTQGATHWSADSF